MNRQTFIIVTALFLCGALLCGVCVVAVVAWRYLDTEGSRILNAQANRRIVLPPSELAVPPEAKPSISVTARAGDRVTVGGREGSITNLASLLREELEAMSEVSAIDCHVFIYGKSDISTGVVQQVITICQDMGFERFELHATDE